MKSLKQYIDGYNVAKFNVEYQSSSYGYDSFKNNDITVVKNETGGIFFAKYSIEVKKVGSYTISCDCDFSGERTSMFLYTDDLWGTSIDKINVSQKGEFEYDITFDKVGTYVLGLYGDEDVGTTYQIKNLMVKLSNETATEYEPYGKIFVRDGFETFKNSINSNGKQITASFDVLGVPYPSELIVKVNPYFDSANALLGSTMKCLEIEMQGLIPVIIDAKITNLKFGVKSDGEYDYINYGTYIVNKYEWDIENMSTTLLCYDKMVESMIPYDLTIDYSNGDFTILDLLQSICDRLGWELGTNEFTNSNIVIDEEKFDSTYTFRSVLEEIGQIAGGKIAFKDDDILYVLYPTETNEIIDESNLKTLTIGKQYGPVNSLVIARTPQEDNIYKRDEESILEHGVIEVKIENNQLMDSHREDFIDNLFERLKGLTFYTYELESYGIGYLELYDLFTLKTHDDKEYSCLFMYDNLEISQGVSENSKAELPEETETNYKVASETDRVINKTILQVDKQDQEIRALITSTQNISGEMNDVKEGYDNLTQQMQQTITATQVQTLISETISNGVDSVTTSTGYTFNKDGLTISKTGEEMENKIDNTGMYVNRDNENILTANNEGVNAINLTARQYLTIGKNSRFEDYKENRTACFYVGGDN